MARLWGRAAGGSTDPGMAWVVGIGHASWWSGGVGEGADAVPGGDDVVGPGPAGLDFQLPPAGAAGDAGGGVQDLVPSLN